MIYENSITKLESFSLNDDRLPVLISEHGSKITIVTGGCYIQRPYEKETNQVVPDFFNLEYWLMDETDDADEDPDKNPLVGIDGSWLALEYEQVNAGTPTARVYGEYIIYIGKTSCDDECFVTEQIKLGVISLQQEEAERLEHWVGRANRVLLG